MMFKIHIISQISNVVFNGIYHDFVLGGKMEPTISKEELKNLKKKMEFWFWFAFVNFSVMSLCFYDQFMEISNSTIAVIHYISTLLLILSAIMFFKRFFKWFIEKED